MLWVGTTFFTSRGMDQFVNDSAEDKRGVDISCDYIKCTCTIMNEE